MRSLVAAGLAMTVALAACSSDAGEDSATQPTAKAGGAENAPTASASHAQLDTAVWDDSAASVTTADADQAFSEILHDIEVFARPEAEIAATVGSIAEYDTAMMSLLAQPGAAESIGTGAAALGTVVTYTRERCGSLPDS